MILSYITKERKESEFKFARQFKNMEDLVKDTFVGYYSLKNDFIVFELKRDLTIKREFTHKDLINCYIKKEVRDENNRRRLLKIILSYEEFSTEDALELLGKSYFSYTTIDEILGERPSLSEEVLSKIISMLPDNLNYVAKNIITRKDITLKLINQVLDVVKLKTDETYYRIFNTIAQTKILDEETLKKMITILSQRNQYVDIEYILEALNFNSSAIFRELLLQNQDGALLLAIARFEGIEPDLLDKVFEKTKDIEILTEIIKNDSCSTETLNKIYNFYSESDVSLICKLDLFSKMLLNKNASCVLIHKITKYIIDNNRPQYRLNNKNMFLSVIDNDVSSVRTHIKILENIPIDSETIIKILKNNKFNIKVNEFIINWLKDINEKELAEEQVIKIISMFLKSNYLKYNINQNNISLILNIIPIKILPKILGQTNIPNLFFEKIITSFEIGENIGNFEKTLIIKKFYLMKQVNSQSKDTELPELNFKKEYLKILNKYLIQTNDIEVRLILVKEMKMAGIIKYNNFIDNTYCDICHRKLKICSYLKK